MNKKFMELAFKAAIQSQKEVPVGAVIARDNQLIAFSGNRVMEQCDVTRHAEIIAIQNASCKLKKRFLNDCQIYITLEPCPMCAYAISLARISAIYFAAYDKKMGAISCGHFGKNGYHHQPMIYDGVMDQKGRLIMQDFFEKIRKESRPTTYC